MVGLNLEQRHKQRMELLQAALKAGMQAAGEKAGLHGGRYVAEQARKGTETLFTPHDPPMFVVLDDDDPKLYNDRLDLDIHAHCTPTKCYGIGRARHYIMEDGSIREDRA